MGRAEEYLNQIPMWTKKKHSVEEVRAFLNALGAPDRDVPAVHVAGTNGKGSVCAFLTSVFRQAGYRIGTFTSPHLVDMRERFLINGAMADEAVFERAFETVRGIVREMEEKGFGHPTFFEFLFYMAVIIFREEKVDVMVIETGLGGRLDATNALEHPAASVITSISMDHTQYLGDTIEKIAWEKAGIIKAGVPVIFDASNPGVRTVIEGAAFRRGAARYPVNSPDFQVEGIRGGHLEVTVRLLRGDSLRLEIPFEALYQAQNAALAVRTLEVLRGPCRQGRAGVPGGERVCLPADRQENEIFRRITNRQIAEGIQTTAWPGRMEQIRPGLYLDGANNPGGIEAFLRTAGEIAASRREKAYLLFSALSDKDYGHMVRLLAEGFVWAGIGVLTLESARGLPGAQLAEEFKKWTACPVTVYQGTGEALPAMLEKAEGELLFCTGSLYLVGEIRKALERV